MLEQALAEISPDAEPKRGSGLYDDAKRNFDRGFYMELYVRFNGNVSQIAKEAGKQRVTVRAALRALGLCDEPGSGAKRQ